MSESKTKVSKNTLYGRATTRLREEHREEFQQMLAAEYIAEGLLYKPRMTAEERDAKRLEERRIKAAQKIQLLKAEFGDDILTDPPF